jgi:hypothetical protein
MKQSSYQEADSRVMAQVVSHRPLIAEARVRAQVSSCGIYGGQDSTETGLSPSSSVFPCEYHSTVAPCTRVIWEMNSRPVGGRNSET